MTNCPDDSSAGHVTLLVLDLEMMERQIVQRSPSTLERRLF
jgi:hypothetical protein